jgi:hypothetical protein
LYDQLATKPEYHLIALVNALKDIQRKDVLEELRQIKEFGHLKWPDSVTGAISGNYVRAPSGDDMTTLTRQESCSVESEFYTQSENSHAASQTFNSCTSGSRVAPELARLVKTKPEVVALENTRPMSMEEQSISVEKPSQECSKNRYGQNDGQSNDYSNALNDGNDLKLRIPVASRNSNMNENNSFPGETSEICSDCSKTMEVPENIEPHAVMLRNNNAAFNGIEKEIPESDISDSRPRLLVRTTIYEAPSAIVMHRS